jgi:undecaprenyl-diphosphatase
MSEPWLQVIALAIIQGVTEFLPVSSSGHLIFFQHLFGIKDPQLLLDVVLHAGTLGAILAVFHRDLWTLAQALKTDATKRAPGQPPPVKTVLYILLATGVTACLGLLLHDFVESLFGGIGLLGPCWLVTGTILWLTRNPPSTTGEMGPGGALIVGLAQTLALVPGVSRSGTTIAAGLLLRWERRWAATFSFLLAIPAILGAVALEIWRAKPGLAGPGLLCLGGVVSLLVGWLSLRWLLRLVLRGKLHYFAWYCWAMGGIALLVWAW